MTAERAAAPNVAKARQFWVYPQGAGAWVFFATGWDSNATLFEGDFWYVDDEKQIR